MRRQRREERPRGYCVEEERGCSVEEEAGEGTARVLCRGGGGEGPQGCCVGEEGERDRRSAAPRASALHAQRPD
eukprot:402500-Rhodomonas_salina.1